MCTWPFAHMAFISSISELDHTGCCDREPAGMHWQNHRLVRHQQVRIRPPSRGSRVHPLNSAPRPVPVAGRRNFPQLARRTIFPATATRVSLVHIYATGPLHMWPLYRAPRSWITPVAAVVNQKGGTGKTSFCGVNKFGFVRLPRGSRVHRLNSAPRPVQVAGRRSLPQLARRMLYPASATQAHRCTYVQRAMCTYGHHIEYLGVGPRQLLQ